MFTGPDSWTVHHTLWSSQSSSRRTRFTAYRVRLLTGRSTRRAAENDGAPPSTKCKGYFFEYCCSATSLRMHRTIGMSGDIPISANSNAEISMRVVFRPLLPVGALAHKAGGKGLR